jgi:hypothetical protein
VIGYLQASIGGLPCKSARVCDSTWSFVRAARTTDAFARIVRDDLAKYERLARELKIKSQ